MDTSYSQRIHRSEDASSRVLGITLAIVIFAFFILIPCVTSKYFKSKFSAFVVFVNGDSAQRTAEQLLQEEVKDKSKKTKKQHSISKSSKKQETAARSTPAIKEDFVNDTDSDIDNLLLLGELSGFKKSSKADPILTPSPRERSRKSSAASSNNVVLVEGRFDPQFQPDSDKQHKQIVNISVNLPPASSSPSRESMVSVTSTSDIAQYTDTTHISVENETFISFRQENENLVNKNAALESRIAALEDSNRVLSKSLTAAQMKAKEDLVKAEKQVSNYSRIAEDLKSSVSKLESERDRTCTLLAEKQTRITSLEARLQSTRSVDSSTTEELLRKENETLLSRISLLTDELESVRAGAQTDQEELVEEREEHGRLLEELDASQEAIANALMDRNEAMEQCEIVEKQKQELQTALTELSVNHASETQKLRSTINSLELELTTLRASNQELIEKSTKLATLESELILKTSQIATLESESAHREARISDLERRIFAKTTSIAALEARLVGDSRNASHHITKLESQLAASKVQIMTLQSQISEMEKDSAKYNEYSTTLLTESHEKVVRLDQELEFSRNSINALQLEISKLQETYSKKTESYETELTQLKKHSVATLELLEETRKMLRDYVLICPTPSELTSLLNKLRNEAKAVEPEIQIQKEIVYVEKRNDEMISKLESTIASLSKQLDSQTAKIAQQTVQIESLTSTRDLETVVVSAQQSLISAMAGSLQDSNSAAAPLTKETESAAEIETLKFTISKLESELRESRNAVKCVTNTVVKPDPTLFAEIAVKEETISGLIAQIALSSNEIEVLNRSVESLKSDLKVAKSAVKEIVLPPVTKTVVVADPKVVEENAVKEETIKGLRSLVSSSISEIEALNRTVEVLKSDLVVAKNSVKEVVLPPVTKTVVTTDPKVFAENAVKEETINGLITQISLLSEEIEANNRTVESLKSELQMSVSKCAELELNAKETVAESLKTNKKNLLVICELETQGASLKGQIETLNGTVNSLKSELNVARNTVKEVTLPPVTKTVVVADPKVVADNAAKDEAIHGLISQVSLLSEEIEANHQMVKTLKADLVRSVAQSAKLEKVSKEVVTVKVVDSAVYAENAEKQQTIECLQTVINSLGLEIEALNSRVVAMTAELEKSQQDTVKLQKSLKEKPTVPATPAPEIVKPSVDSTHTSASLIALSSSLTAAKEELQALMSSFNAQTSGKLKIIAPVVPKAVASAPAFNSANSILTKSIAGNNQAIEEIIKAIEDAPNEITSIVSTTVQYNIASDSVETLVPETNGVTEDALNVPAIVVECMEAESPKPEEPAKEPTSTNTDADSFEIISSSEVKDVENAANQSSVSVSSPRNSDVEDSNSDTTVISRGGSFEQATSSLTPHSSLTKSKRTSLIKTLTKRKHEDVGTTEVTLTIHEARNLIAADLNGTSDPFIKVVVLSLADPNLSRTVHKTVIVRRNLNPKWNETCTFRVGTDIGSYLPLIKLQIKDYNTFKGNVNIGEVIIDLNTIIGTENIAEKPVLFDRWVDVDGKNGSHGDVKISGKIQDIKKS